MEPVKGKSLYLVIASLLLALGAIIAIYNAVTAETMDYLLLLLGAIQLVLAVGLMMKYSIAFYGVFVLTLISVLKTLFAGDLGEINTLISLMLNIVVLLLLIMGSSMQVVTAKLPARVLGENGYRFFRKLN